MLTNFIFTFLLIKIIQHIWNTLVKNLYSLLQKLKMKLVLTILLNFLNANIHSTQNMIPSFVTNMKEKIKITIYVNCNILKMMLTLNEKMEFTKNIEQRIHFNDVFLKFKRCNNTFNVLHKKPKETTFLRKAKLSDYYLGNFKSIDIYETINKNSFYVKFNKNTNVNIPITEERMKNKNEMLFNLIDLIDELKMIKHRSDTKISFYYDEEDTFEFNFSEGLSEFDNYYTKLEETIDIDGVKLNIYSTQENPNVFFTRKN